MENLWTICLVVCPLVFLAGFVDSVAGGGGLISLPAYLFVGIPPHLAAGTNKVVNGIGTAAAAWRYIRSGKVYLQAAVWAALGALVGAAIGAKLALWCPEDVLKGCMVAVLPSATLNGLRNACTPKATTTPLTKLHTRPTALIVSALSRWRAPSCRDM